MKSIQKRQAFTLHTNKPGNVNVPSVFIDGQWREVQATPKTVQIPAVAWLVVASVGAFMGVFFSVVAEHITIENTIWFGGGMIAGGMLSAAAVGLFSYLVYSANRNS